MAVIADRCPQVQVNVVDINQARIAAWNDPDLTCLPVYEPGLDSVVSRARGRNLYFSTEVDAAIASADMVFLSVNTPTKTRGVGAGQASDLRWIEACTRQVALAATGHTIVVEKSTLSSITIGLPTISHPSRVINSNNEYIDFGIEPNLSSAPTKANREAPQRDTRK